MSVAMYWRPIGEEQPFESHYTQECLAILVKHTGFHLSRLHIPELRVTALLYPRYEHFLNELADKLDEVGALEVTYHRTETEAEVHDDRITRN
jgi:hypothetical protein